MSGYNAPTKDMLFVINEMAGLAELPGQQGFEEVTNELVAAVLEQASRFSREVLEPLNKSGDRRGSKLVERKVVVPPGFADAYRQFVQNGWVGLSQSTALGGQGLPFLIGTAVSEMWNASNMAFSLCPMLNTGAVEVLQSSASEALRSIYLPKLVTGEWTATMNITEPQAGTDLAAIRCKAQPVGDRYHITGQKIFITWGDHEMARNVVHLVLARLPDAPKGVRGISLFLVPKFLLNADGSLGDRNDAYAVSLEHKLGVHASPTCAMSFGEQTGAVGYLVGEPNDGLACMFKMMNHARLGCGVQALAIADRAYQQATDYARNRNQGFAEGFDGQAPIIQHCDVRRMLMLMRSQTEAMRGLTYVSAAALDKAHRCENAEDRNFWESRVALLTPIVKGWCTEVAQEVATLGIQVHGGTGYIEETGAAQYLRDVRITTIYEGTTGIQAMDLVGRKVLKDRGAALWTLLAELDSFADTHSRTAETSIVSMQNVADGGALVRKAAELLIKRNESDPSWAGAVAYNFLMLTGTVIAGWHLAKGAIVSEKKLADANADAGFLRAKIAVARFYAEQLMPRSIAYGSAAMAGSDAIMQLPADQL